MPARFCPWSVNDKKSEDENILDAESIMLDDDSMRVVDALALLISMASIIDMADTGSKRFKEVPIGAKY